MMISRLRPKILRGCPWVVTNSFMTSVPIKVSTPAIPNAASKPVTAELLTMVLTVVVTVEIISQLNYTLAQKPLICQ